MMTISGGQMVFFQPARDPDDFESGTYVCTETATAIPSLPATLIELVVQADGANKTDVLVGGTASQPIKLPPGAVYSFGELNTVDKIYVKKAEAKDAVINWIARKPNPI